MPTVAIVAMERGWLSICRLPEVLARAGLVVHALCDPRSPLAASRHVARVIRWDRRSTKLPGARRRLWRLIRQAAPDWVIPGDDRAAHYLSRLRDGVSPRGEEAIQAVLHKSLPSWDVVTRLDFKDEFAAACGQLGIPVVPTRALPLAELERDPHAAVTTFPAILKLSFGEAGNRVIGIRTPAELPKAVRTLRERFPRSGPLARRLRHGWDLSHHPRGRDPVACIQPWIDGPGHQLAFVAFGGRILGGTAWHTLERRWRFGPSSVVRSVERPDVFAQVQRLVATTGFVGFGHVEFIDERATGRTYLLEMNVRPVAAHALGALAGADLGRLFAAALDGVTPDPIVGRAGVTVALFPNERERDPASPYLLTALHQVPWDDPELLARLGGAPEAAPAGTGEYAQGVGVG